MGHYDNCRPGYCAACGAAPGNIKNGVCEICEKQARARLDAIEKDSLPAKKQPKKKIAAVITKPVEVDRVVKSKDFTKQNKKDLFKVMTFALNKVKGLKKIIKVKEGDTFVKLTSLSQDFPDLQKGLEVSLMFVPTSREGHYFTMCVVSNKREKVLFSRTLAEPSSIESLARSFAEAESAESFLNSMTQYMKSEIVQDTEAAVHVLKTSKKTTDGTVKHKDNGPIIFDSLGLGEMFRLEKMDQKGVFYQKIGKSSYLTLGSSNVKKLRMSPKQKIVVDDALKSVAFNLLNPV